MLDSTQRFSGRVSHYERYRPTYPRAVLDVLESQCGLSGSSVVADIGSGTGILARLFLDRGLRVYGVEPNGEMREAGERLLAGYAHFTSVEGRGEATGLADRCVDFVAVGQAFHWFDPKGSRVEFQRILKPGGWVVLVWNWRRGGSTPFLAALEELLTRLAPEYPLVRQKQLDLNHIRSFFEPDDFRTVTLGNEQVLDYGGLEGLMRSASYMPVQGHPNHEPFFTELRSIYDAHQVGDRVILEYDTVLYLGQLGFD